MFYVVCARRKSQMWPNLSSNYHTHGNTGVIALGFGGFFSREQELHAKYRKTWSCITLWLKCNVYDVGHIFIPTFMVKISLWRFHFNINLHGHPQIFWVNMLRIFTISAHNSYTCTDFIEIHCRTNALFELASRKTQMCSWLKKACQAVDGAVAKGDVDLTLIVDLRRIRERFSGWWKRFYLVQWKILELQACVTSERYSIWLHFSPDDFFTLRALFWISCCDTLSRRWCTQITQLVPTFYLF